MRVAPGRTVKGCFASLIGIVLMTAALTIARDGHAAPPERSAGSVLDLTWDAPAGCPSAINVEQAVRRLVGEGHGAAPLHVRARVREESGTFHVVLEVGEGERDVVAPTCELATEAAAVVIATLIPEDVAREPSAPPPPPSAFPLPSPLPSPPPPRALWLALGAFAESGTLPEIAPGLAVSAAWHIPHRYAVRLDLGATASSDATGRTTVDGRTLGGDFRLYAIGLRGELPLFGTPVSFTAGVEAGILHAAATGALDPGARDAGWFALCGGAIGHWRVGERVALVTSLELVVPPVRPSFTIDNDFIHRPAAAGGRALIGAEIGF